ncbi:protein STRUBBELIG-RECEPTOR FAMILY 6-like isoform X1 [Typha angustifolia]|uniref:protein STRUBBELIG-RECEPTOR FAMILY 6-like isoform X1 n=1 Tax=Typha angustifolia TaxID=59011 RepID=UPI003C2E6E65
MVKEKSRRRREKGVVEGVVVLVLVCIWVWNPSFANANTDPSDVSDLNALYSSLNSATQLTGWTSNSGDPCGQSWLGIACSGSAVTAIKLSGMGLTGTLGYMMANMTSLMELDLSNNNLGGGNQIPYNLPPNLQRLNLAGNQFSGSVPYSISQIITLKYLNLAHNQLQGSLSDMFLKLSNLTLLDLSFNSLTGDLPQSFNTLSSLTTLYLQNNQLTGPIDVLASLPLEDLNVANNHFTGWIPNQLMKINNLQTEGNSWSSGPAPPPPPYMPPPPSRRTSPGQHSGGESSPTNGVRSGDSSGGVNDGGSGGRNSGIGGGGIAGIIISILAIGGIVAFFLIKRKSRKSPKEENIGQDRPFSGLDSDLTKDVADMKPIQASAIIDMAALPPTAQISLKPPPVFDRHKSFDEDEFSNKPVVKKANTTPIRATLYSVADLQVATDSFSIDRLIGEGSFGRVYKAQFNDGKVLAVKKISSAALANQSLEDFIELVSSISQLQHPNLTELVGYCTEHGQHMLVYQYHKNGSLHDLLHLTDEFSKPLTWSIRVKIALGTARALEYLHEVCSPSIIHKNFKSSNILLDSELNPHLCDSGLASLVPNAEFQLLRASEQNSAPEVAMSGQYTLKSDVYSFGVVMLELLTGRKSFDISRPRSEQSLVNWAIPQLHDIDSLDQMVDPALEGLYPAKSLSRFADVIALCVQAEPEFRPPISEVVQSLLRLVQRANMSKRTFGSNAQEISRRANDSDVQDYSL